MTVSYSKRLKLTTQPSKYALGGLSLALLKGSEWWRSQLAIFLSDFSALVVLLTGSVWVLCLLRYLPPPLKCSSGLFVFVSPLGPGG